MSLNTRDTENLRAALQEAVVKCSERCLYQSAKWAAEFLTSLPIQDGSFLSEDSQMADDSEARAVPAVITGNADADEAALEAKEINKYLLAKSLFDCREYDRCADVFLPEKTLSRLMSDTLPGGSQSSSTPRFKGKARSSTASNVESSVNLPNLSQKSLFLALYAKYMSGEKKKDEESEMVMGPHDSGTTTNKQLVVINRFLNSWLKKKEASGASNSQGWLEFLYGMVLAKDKNEEEAMRWLIRSVHIYPMNWACWQEITGLISRVDDLNTIAPHLPQNIIAFIFHLHTSLELYQSGPTLSSQVDQLLAIFPDSPFLLSQQALLSYHSKDFSAAESHFSHLLATHPYRLDSLDHYSNILYVLNLKPKLSFLAHISTTIDKFRPETCVIVGNYYSVISQHEKAVNYFRRALTLDRTCLSAWTLMGHEYVELKNTHAAIESYRRAVDVNRRDYRAWYGLGQTYEVLEMHAYALWYYKRAAGLRPWDAKMWMAVASCLQKMGRDQEGIKALKRVLLADSYQDAGVSSSFGSSRTARGNGGSAAMEPEVLLQIAGMYERLEDEPEARAYMELCLAQEEGPVGAQQQQQDELGASINIHADSPESADGSSESGGGGGTAPKAPGNIGTNGGGGDLGGGGGTGVTAATSKARMWLAKYAMRTGDFGRAMKLATELCQDGVGVEEAKALVREVRARGEAQEDIS